MDISSFDPRNSGELLAVPMPSSFNSLPQPSRLSTEQLAKAFELEKMFTQQSQILPGTYTKFDDVELLIRVHDRLWETLENELEKFDNLAICKKLYKKLEVIIGYMYQGKYHSAALQRLTGSTQSTEKQFDTWAAITPFTEGIKFLLEMSVKYCGGNGLVSGESKIDYLIGLSARIVILDGLLEALSMNIVPFEVTIYPDFRIQGDYPQKVKDEKEKFEKQMRNHAIQANTDFIDDITNSISEKVKIEDFNKFPEVAPLNEAMKEELGYGFQDWLKYTMGCLSLFGRNDYFKLIGVPRLVRYLQRSEGLESETIKNILRDHALSQSTLQGLGRDELMPAAHYKRDSRLLRRPLVIIKHDEAEIAMMGIETFSIGSRIFFESLEFGNVQIPQLRINGPVKRALGRMQSTMGAPFRDSILKKCKEMKLRAEPEWSVQPKDKAGKGVGPIDILLVDKKAKRLILVEAKNIQDRGILPREMKKQSDRFLGKEGEDDSGYIRILKAKERSFIENIGWNLHRLNIENGSDYSVESVIVVLNPLFWPHFSEELLPILDDLEFYNRLKSGQSLPRTQ